MSEQFNLDDLFGQMEQETKLTSVLMFPKKGDELLLAMLPPTEFEGKPKLSVAIEADFNGKVSQQHIVRFILIPKEGKVFGWDKVQFVGIPLAPTYVAQLIKLYKTDYQLAQQECNLLVLNKGEKTVITPTPKTIKIPDEVWNHDNQPTWEDLVKAHQDMKTNMAAKKNGKADEKGTEKNPWD
jgi:hypothetical protein